MRNPTINAALEVFLSRERLEKYLEAAGGDLDRALTLYERNTRLSEAFYTPLQCLEICLRNGLHRQMVARYGQDWLQAGTAPLAHDAVEQVGQVTAGIDPGLCTPGKIVAELRFGFWVGLMGPRYDASLWRQALYKAFLAGGGLPRKVVHGRFNALRRLRNRVAHHEPIFDRPTEQFHREIIEAISWMNRDAAAWARHQSRFAAVYAGQEP